MTDTTASKTAETESRKNDKTAGAPRSPSYPYINLQTSIERVRAIYEHENRNAAPLEVIARHWGFSPKSSAGRQTIGALSAFGLVDQVGQNYKLTDRAWRIILDPQDSPERRTALQEAAIAPPIHKKLWQKFNKELPSDVNLKRTLIFDEKFYEKAVDGFIAEYKESIRYAGLLDAGTLPPVDQNAGKDGTGMNVNTGVAPPESLPPKGGGSTGEHEFLKSKISPDLTVRVFASGPVTARDIDKLVRMLTLQKELLDETN